MVCITLNVGGTLFETSCDTLMQKNTFFRALVEHETTMSPPYFIDRDPTHFRHILNFLRGTPSFPDTASQIKELSNEADFYSIPQLVGLAEQQIALVQRESVSHQLSLIVARLG